MYERGPQNKHKGSITIQYIHDYHEAFDTLVLPARAQMRLMLVGENQSMKNFNTYSVQLKWSTDLAWPEATHLRNLGTSLGIDELQLGFKPNPWRFGVPGNIFRGIGDFVFQTEGA